MSSGGKHQKFFGRNSSEEILSLARKPGFPEHLDDRCIPDHLCHLVVNSINFSEEIHIWWQPNIECITNQTGFGAESQTNRTVYAEEKEIHRKKFIGRISSDEFHRK